MVQGEELGSDGMPERIAAAEREIADLQQKVDALRQSQAQQGGQVVAMAAPSDLKVGLSSVVLHRWGQVWRLERSPACNARSQPGGLCFRRPIISIMAQRECPGATGKLLKGGASAKVLELWLQPFSWSCAHQSTHLCRGLTANAGLMLHIPRPAALQQVSYCWP